MRIDVKLIIAGKIFTETVLARDYDHAKQIALARNPGATVVSITANFRDPNKASSFDLDSLINKNQKSSSNEYQNISRRGSNKMDLQSFIGLCILGGSIWIFVTYTPILFLGGAAVIGAGIGKLMPKHKLVTGAILAIILGYFGYSIGEKLQDNWTYNNHIEKADNS